MIPVTALGLFAVSAAVMLLWNWIVPSVVGWNVLGYWQAMGLFVLCRILFGGFRFGFRKHHRDFKRHVESRAPFRDRFMEMNDEERQNFKSQWKQRCCK
jgi:hypothetical protein